LANRLAGYGYGALGAYLQARPLLERALAIRETALGPNHSYTVTSLDNLAELFRAAGELATARPFYERALAICERALGPDHPQTTAVRNNLAALVRGVGT
jgi:tetratricopeptide (TPR) repeat protein